MSGPHKIWFCQFAHCASLFVSRSAIAPKMKVRSRAKSDWAISKSDVPSSAFFSHILVKQQKSISSSQLCFSSWVISKGTIFNYKDHLQEGKENLWLKKEDRWSCWDWAGRRGGGSWWRRRWRGQSCTQKQCSLYRYKALQKMAATTAAFPQQTVVVVGSMTSYQITICLLKNSSLYVNGQVTKTQLLYLASSENIVA